MSFLGPGYHLQVASLGRPYRQLHRGCSHSMKPYTYHVPLGHNRLGSSPRIATALSNVTINVKLLHWAFDNGCSAGAMAAVWVARHGNIEVLQAARARGCPWDADRYHGVCDAARYGHLHVLKWACDQGCPRTTSACEEAVKGGHFEVLKWLRAAGFPWEGTAPACAADGGHLEMLKWITSKGRDWPDCTNAWCGAVSNGHIHNLEWLRANDHDWKGDLADMCACAQAAFSGQLEVLKWACADGVPMGQNCGVRCDGGRAGDVAVGNRENYLTLLLVGPPKVLPEGPARW